MTNVITSLFPIVNFPFISSNIAASSSHGVYISQCIRYARACAQYSDIMGRVDLLAKGVLKQSYVAIMLEYKQIGIK
jgi:hypothetical protein